MKTKIVLLFIFLNVLDAQYVTPKQGWFNFTTPFPDTLNNFTHVGRFILEPPAGIHGRVVVRPDGHLYFANGRRAKFFGTNFCFSATYPAQSMSSIVASHIAKQGFNMVRFHHIDDALTSAPGSNTSRRLNHEVLGRFDYLFYQLKQKGIYSAIDLYSIRTFKSGDGIPYYDSVNRSMDVIKRVYMFYEPAYALFRDYPDSLLNHINPYTGIAYKNEPALVFINPMNEGTLIDHYFWDNWDNTQSDYYLPRFYKNYLQNQWNEWLYNRYRWDSTLIRVWSGGDTTVGPNKIVNGEFSDTLNGLPRNWWLNQFSGSSTWGVQNAGLSTEPAVFVHVYSPGQYSWHIQLLQSGFTIRTDSTYRLSFKAKSSRNRSMDVVIQRNRTPWTVYYSTTVNITTTAQSFLLPFYSGVSDTVQLTFNLGSDTGRVWIDDVQLRKAPFSKVLDPGESLATRTIRLVRWSNRYEYSPYRYFDQIRFFYDKEAKFYQRITALLNDTLQCQSLITSSYFWANQLHQYAWANLVPVLDAHPYFDHPSFPNRPWDTLDFRITNSYFGDGSNGEWFFTYMNQCASAQKPMIITEWQHPAPCESRYIVLLPFASYAGLRDYDAIINFAFAHSEGGFSNNRIRPFFDAAGQPIHFILLRMAALAFLRDIQPEDLQRTPWTGLNFEQIIRDIYAGNYWSNALSSSPRDRIFNQFHWNSQKAIFRINTRGTKVFAGRTANDTTVLGGIRVIGNTDGVIGFTRIDSTLNQETFLVAALARTENTNMVWVEQTKTQGMLNWGTSPCQVESVSYYTQWHADSLLVSRLNPSGNVISSRKIVGTNRITNWLLRTGIDSVPWYQVRAYGFSDTMVGIIEKGSSGEKTIQIATIQRDLIFKNLPANTEIRLFSIDGRLVCHKRLIQSCKELFIPNLPSGVYFYTLRFKGLEQKGKVVIIE
ncbi:MAG: carbohydrate binding domain-containing protein [candidate division WOR-3 bacterium]|nr:carbohydrate binding domain-containing protein [candidate division WOR-3 bacterium]